MGRENGPSAALSVDPLWVGIWQEKRPLIAILVVLLFTLSSFLFFHDLLTRNVRLYRTTRLTLGLMAWARKSFPDQRPIELEVMAFGRAPLAISARCYHARAHQLSKDSCRFVCEQDLDGLEVETLDRKRFLAINGVQTLASGCTVIAREIAALQQAGVTRIRLSPHSCDLVAVATAYRDLLDGRTEPDRLMTRIGELALPGPVVNGYVHGQPGAALVSV